MASRLQALIQKRGLLPQREAAELLAGAPIPGSWWGHPAGKRIFNALTALAEDPELAVVKLIDGKLTYVHRRLWPALVRAAREASLWPALSEAAARLLRELEREGGGRVPGKMRLELERSLKVIGMSVHTAAGHHETNLIPLEKWASAETRRAAEAMPLDEALAALGDAGWKPPAKKKAKKARM